MTAAIRTSLPLTLALLLAAATAAAACGDPKDRAPAAGDLRVGPLGPAPTPATSSTCEFPAAQLVIRTDEAWRSAWTTLFACLEAPPPPPSIDFAREMVLLVALGARPTAGYLVAITSAVLDGAGTWQVEVAEYRPGAGCASAAVVTWPVAMARVTRSDATAVFHPHADVYDCE